MLVEIGEGLLLRLDCCLLTDLNLTNSGAAYSVSRGCFVCKPNPFKSSLSKEILNASKSRYPILTSFSKKSFSSFRFLDARSSE